MDNLFISFFATFISSFTIVSFAEMGDKSQLVCMILATRYRVWPVFFGAISAFIILNLIAVIFGTIIAQWIPEQLLILLVGCLFLIFGFIALNSSTESISDNNQEKLVHSIFFSTFLLIAVAEFGDKTQLVIAGLASTNDPYAIWAGATTALIFTSALGIWAGYTLLQNISHKILHQISAAIFILMGILSLLSLM